MKGLDLNILLLCFTVALCTYSVIARSEPELKPDWFITRKRLYTILAGSIFVLAVLVRAYLFGQVPNGLNQDGAMAAVDAHALADYGTDRFGMRFPAYFTAWGYGQMSILMSVLMVPFIKLLGLTVVAIRLPTLLVSIAAMLVLFLFVKKVLGKTPALIVLAFVAINPWQIMQSRWALECNLLPHFLLFSLYFLYLGLEKRAFLYVSMVFFGLTMYTYGIAFYTVPILMIVLCVYLLVRKRIKPWEAAVSALVYLFVGWPILAVVAVNAFKLSTIDTGFITIPFYSQSIRTNDLILYAKHFFPQLLDNFLSMMNIAVLEKGDFNWNFIENYGHMYLFTLPFVVTGLWALFRRRPKGQPEQETPEAAQPDRAARFILIAWLAVAVFSGLMVNNVNTNRINIIFYPMILLASLGIWHVVRHAAHMRRVAVAVILVYAVSFGGFTNAYFGEHADQLAHEFCSGLTDAIHYADGLDTDVLYITADSRSEGAFTCSEVYTLFGADIDAHYFQGNAGAVNRVTGKALLPYKQRYQYVDFSQFPFGKPVGSVYVLNSQEADMFDPYEYDFRQFGDFEVAVKVREAAPLPDDGESEDDGAVG